MPDTRPDCYACTHRRNLPGSAHSSCHHPATKPIHDNPLAGLVALMGGDGPIYPQVLGVVGNPNGIKRGWFSWPCNFDPNWLQACDGFEARAQKEPA